MELRVFDLTVRVASTDGERTATFNRGERVRHVRRIGRGVIFEAVDPRHIAGTYVMEWSTFERSTLSVRVARA
jgi:hypothetical protein